MDVASTTSALAVNSHLSGVRLYDGFYTQLLRYRKFVIEVQCDLSRGKCVVGSACVGEGGVGAAPILHNDVTAMRYNPLYLVPFLLHQYCVTYTFLFYTFDCCF